MGPKLSTTSQAITVKQSKFMMCRVCILKPSCTQFCYDYKDYDYMTWFLSNTICPHCGHHIFYISEHDKLTHHFICKDCKSGYLCTYHQREKRPWDMHLGMKATTKYSDLTRIAFHKHMKNIFGYEIGLRLERRIRDD